MKIGKCIMIIHCLSYNIKVLQGKYRIEFLQKKMFLKEVANYNK